MSFLKLKMWVQRKGLDIATLTQCTFSIFYISRVDESDKSVEECNMKYLNVQFVCFFFLHQDVHTLIK